MFLWAKAELDNTLLARLFRYTKMHLLNVLLGMVFCQILQSIMHIMCVYCGDLFRIVSFLMTWTFVYFYKSQQVSITHVMDMRNIYKII